MIYLLKNETKAMKTYKLLLSYMLAVFIVISNMDVTFAESNQQIKNNANKVQPKLKAPQKTKPSVNPIVGEIKDYDTMPIEDEESDPDAIQSIPPRPKTIADNPPLDKDKAKVKKTNKTREKLLEGFQHAHQFHISWFNLPSTKIKSSHENLIKFCKVACTKKNCADTEVADKCHLMCPSFTTKQCPDPLKAAEDIDREEVMLGSDISLKKSSTKKGPVMNEDAIAQGSLSPIEQAERSLENIGEEG